MIHFKQLSTLLTMTFVFLVTINTLPVSAQMGGGPGMHNHGGGMGSTAMMGHGGGMGGHEGDTMGGGHDVGSHSGHEQGEEPLTREHAIDLMEEHLKTKAKEIPDLALGNVSESKDYFEAEITDQEGAVVDQVRVSKSSKKLESVKFVHPIFPEGHVH